MVMTARFIAPARRCPLAAAAMPRSFLVKKPSSTRVPDYGRLLESRRQQDPNGSGHPWRATGHPLCVPDGGPCPAPGEVARLRDRGSVIACLSLLPLPQSSQAGGDPAGGTRLPSTPLRDNQNNLNLPPAAGLPPRRTPASLGGLVEGEGEKPLGVPGGPAGPPGRPECRGCHKAPRPPSGLARDRQPRCPLQAAAARKYLTCKYCDKDYASLGALKMHIRTHTLPCVCKICGKAFSRPWLLQGHIRTHTGEKPYTCSHCSRAFADRSNLRAHLQTHSDVKKYQCSTCSKTFSRMSLLLRHEEAGCCPAT
ncbi:zinc finger protein SNAI3 [Hemicordylus capensis]|uniref:zinc finger protein SNAI3 n=1 Tax=Hemicordylus capensis TaxID=884348 RepID=UPI002303FCED|nr:zinc finger protein SNAI3 [Hemicordylus capensis]